MKIILDIRYNRRLINARLLELTKKDGPTPTATVDITSLVDNLATNSIRRIADKVARAAKRAELAANKTETPKRKPKKDDKP